MLVGHLTSYAEKGGDDGPEHGWPIDLVTDSGDFQAGYWPGLYLPIRGSGLGPPIHVLNVDAGKLANPYRVVRVEDGWRATRENTQRRRFETKREAQADAGIAYRRFVRGWPDRVFRDLAYQFDCLSSRRQLDDPANPATAIVAEGERRFIWKRSEG